MRIRYLLLAAALGPTALAQTATPAQPPVPAQPPAPAQAAGKVLFSGPPVGADTQKRSATVANPTDAGEHVTVTDTERTAWTPTAYDLDVHLTPADASLAVEARLTLRNDGTQALARVPLQLSSSLHMERVSFEGRRLALARHLVDSDADHTGRLEETVATLAQPVAPGASVTLTAAYAGSTRASTDRLARLGIPAEAAANADWDRIGEDFTGLRGFGQVVWYPVVSQPALLGDAAKLPAEVNRQRLRAGEATITLRVTDEFSGPAPTVAVLAGRVLDGVKPQTPPSGSLPGIVQVSLPATRLGFQFPSLVLGAWVASQSTSGVRIYTTPAHAGAVANYRAAAALAQPVLARWLGKRTALDLAILDLPVNQAQPSEQGDALMASLVDAPAEEIAPLLAQELARVSFHSPYLWLEQGVPAFLGALATEQQRGREAALEQLAASSGALAFAEPASPGSAAGQDLLHASDPIYYRAKALNVLWMLRDLAGDGALATALATYDPAADPAGGSFETLVEKSAKKDLRWFFDAWVYHDMGLADLSIANVFSTRAGSDLGGGKDQWLVTVDVANDGYAEVEAPITVRSATAAVTERVRVAGRAKVSRRVLIVGAPTLVEVNDGSVPEVGASIHRRAIE